MLLLWLPGQSHTLGTVVLLGRHSEKSPEEEVPGVQGRGRGEGESHLIVIIILIY